MFDEYDTVQLKHDLPAHNLKAGIKGAVVMVFTEPYQAYLIDLSDDEGWTLEVLTLRDDDLTLVSKYNHN